MKDLIKKKKKWIVLLGILLGISLYLYACRPVGEVVSRTYNMKVTTTRLNENIYSTTVKELLNYSTKTETQSAVETVEEQAPTMPLEATKQVESTSYTNEAYFETTCYCLQGTTASGDPVQPETVAVDPNIIPLGTEMWIEGYGRAIARDTGGDIVGYRLDIWLESCDACIQYGRQMTLARWN